MAAARSSADPSFSGTAHRNLDKPHAAGSALGAAANHKPNGLVCFLSALGTILVSTNDVGRAVIDLRRLHSGSKLYGADGTGYTIILISASSKSAVCKYRIGDCEIMGPIAKELLAQM